MEANTWKQKYADSRFFEQDGDVYWTAGQSVDLLQILVEFFQNIKLTSQSIADEF